MPRIRDIDRFIFIVGAPRCGTTTMARWLQAHRQVLFPFVKEPHFFAQHDLRGLGEAALRHRVEEDYLDHFFPDAEGERNVGADCSVSYLYTPEQLEPALKLWPKSRFIVGLRDPLTLLPSLHKRLIFTGDENIRRFEDAWGAVPDRAAGRRIPWSTIEPRWLRYDEAARYGTYVERLFAAVGKERCLVMLFDDLVADPAEQHHRLLEFAGLDPMPAPELKAERESKGVRFLLLQQLLKHPPRALLPYLASVRHHGRFDKEAGAKAKQTAPGGARKSLRKRLLRWNKVPDERRPVPLAVQREIKARFQEEVDRLGVLIGRDLSHWLQPRQDQVD
ncbi:MAG TPA: sulfotransferase [Sphingomicrobium sp.]|nr:sulfotransferase [Sphingomicrobium sp.]